MEEKGVLLAKVETLDRSRRGHVSTLTRICNEIDLQSEEYVNVVMVKQLEDQLGHAFKQYCACCEKYAVLLEDSCEKYQEVYSQYRDQQTRKLCYEQRVQVYVQGAATFFNEQVTEDVRKSYKASPVESVKCRKTSPVESVKSYKTSPVESVKSVSSGTSRLSACSTRARETRLAAAKATLLQQQAEERKRRTVELEVKKVELEIKQKEIELQHRLEMTMLEADNDVAAARNQAELATLEARIAEQEISSLTGNRPDIGGEVFPASVLPQKDIPITTTQATVSSSPKITVTSAISPLTPNQPFTSTPLSALAPTFVRLPRNDLQSECLQEEVKFPTSPSVFTSPHDAPKAQASVLAPRKPVAVPTVLSPQLWTNNPATATPRVSDTCINESLLTTIASTMGKISMTQDLPKIQVQKFDGSPDKFPIFRQRFRQMVETRPLEEPVKMTLLLQFLEGPALKAVQRYEAIQGGFTRAMKTLEDRFGRPCQVVRACVDTLTKGPVIQPSDKEGLQQYADNAQVTYDILSEMGYLGEVNTDILEQMILRLPKWAQTKFVESLKRLERGGQTMPRFKDVVEFLKERAEVLNHPFLSKPLSEAASAKSVKPNERFNYRPTSVRITTLATTSRTAESCPMCLNPHRLYRCDIFKSKTPRERSEFVKIKRICFNCLSSTDHTAKMCKCLIRCQAPGCGKLHHTMLHYSEFQLDPRAPRENRYGSSRINNAADIAQQDEVRRGSCSATSKNDSHEIMLQVIPLRVTSENNDTITTYGLIDSGSDVTFIDPSLAKDMKMNGTPGKLSINTVSDNNVLEEAVMVNFKLAPVDSQDNSSVNVRSAWAAKELTIPLKHTQVTQHAMRWPHLQQIHFPEVERKKISVLIGTNVQEAFIPLEVRKGGTNEPIAIKSCLGWSVLGGQSRTDASKQFNSNLVIGTDVSLNRQLEEFWRIELQGTDKPEHKPMSVEDHKAKRVIEETITKVGDNYQLGLLWRDDNPCLPYNRVLAEARLRHLKKRFLRDPELERKYKAVIEEYLKKGYARKLTKEEAAVRSNVTWYLPHHPVLNPNKPGKIRVVFDAAAKFANTSLNDHLVQGPSLVNDLSGVLLRFRQHEAAFTADIEAMFYQAKVTPKDTDALRFLWWSGSADDPPEEYQMLVHIFGAKSSPCCANKALKMTAETSKEKYSNEVVESVHRNFYVDDVLKSVQTTEQAVHIAVELVKLLKEGGFRLTKFTSNRREILAEIPPEERADPTLDLDLDRLPIERALGISWDAQSDTFRFKVVPTEKPSTKRGILSVVSSLFDPLGFLAPFVLPVKILLQDLWRMEFLWDEKIPEPYLSQWRKWTESLPHIVNISIPRCYKNINHGAVATLQLHHFSDASRRGYAAVSYLRMVDGEGNIHCVFVMGKTRNCPTKEVSIPRLELQAAVLATRLHTTLLSELDLAVAESHFWTDSMTALQYIKNKSRRFHTFVANRVTEIHDATSPKQWHFVPGSLNPADEGSRGMDIQLFTPECRWWTSAEFLWKPEDQWPKGNVSEITDDDKEVRKEGNVMSVTTGSLHHLLRRYSSWSKLLRVTSYVLRFVKRIKKEKPYPTTLMISLGEINLSSQVLMKMVQGIHFKEELLALQRDEQVKSSSKLATLNPTLVNGIIRVGGRIHHAPIAFDAAHPVILPKEHELSTAIVRHYHRILGHAGREHVLSVIRQRYWIPGGRSLVRCILRQCVDCRKRNARTVQQMMGNLPKERLIPYQPPFTYTGIDFFGPFHVKRGRGTTKVYGCIFVCFNSRAVHIEDVSSLETDTFIQALRRFISVRGHPKEIWSDNGTNFTGAERELRRSIQEFNGESIKRELHPMEIEWNSCPMLKWRFQPPAASHMSGVWERLIRSVRKTMKAVLGNPNARVGPETLRTVFAEVVSILNSRPLCPSSDDPTDVEPITPNHLLLQRQSLVMPPGVFTERDLYSRKQWRHAQFLANCFWSRWIREYIPTLQQRQKWLHNKRNIQVNDLVLVVEHTQPRARWLLGRVTRVFPGEDKCVRTVEIKTRSSVLVRPVAKLCLLEES